MKPKRRYPNGYYPKLEYWNGRLAKAIKSQNTEEIAHCLKSLTFFCGRQIEKEYNAEMKAFEEMKADSDLSVMKDEGLA